MSVKRKALGKEHKAVLMLIIREDACNHGPEREHGTKVEVRLVANLYQTQLSFCQATSALVVLGTDMQIV